MVVFLVRKKYKQWMDHLHSLTAGCRRMLNQRYMWECGLALFPGSTHLLEQQTLCETQVVSGPGNEAGGWSHTRLCAVREEEGVVLVC